jgi:hypothetical protein
LAENGKNAISSLKIRTWTNIPLKVGFIATFRGLLSDCSVILLKHSFFQYFMPNGAIESISPGIMKIYS